MAEHLRQLHWQHPTIGRISETVCPDHQSLVCAALRVLGIGSMTSDGSVPLAGYEGPDELATCLRCQAHPAMEPRELLRQWYGEAGQ